MALRIVEQKRFKEPPIYRVEAEFFDGFFTRFRTIRDFYTLEGAQEYVEFLKGGTERVVSVTES